MRAPPSDGFVGRQDRLDAIQTALEAPSRLVTLTGPGGVGKTRLALEFASRSSARWVLLDVNGLRDPQAAVRTLIGAVPRARDLTRALHELRGTCLLIDGFEGLVESTLETIETWREKAHDTRFLVTSRVALDVAAERIVEVAGLNDDEALQLFRTRTVEGGRDSTDEPALTSLLERLDGLPLAVELAASRGRTLSLSELESRLDQGLDVLKTRRRDVRRQHTTIEATLAWSWELLSPEEQHTLSRCSLFRGAFALADAEAVVAFGDVSAENLIDHIEALCRHHLLARGADDTFEIHQLVRAFALARLPTTDLTIAETRHSAHLLQRTQKWLNLAMMYHQHMQGTASTVPTFDHANLEVVASSNTRTPQDRARALITLACIEGKSERTARRMPLFIETDAALSSADRHLRAQLRGIAESLPVYSRDRWCTTPQLRAEYAVAVEHNDPILAGLLCLVLARRENLERRHSETRQALRSAVRYARKANCPPMAEAAKQGLAQITMWTVSPDKAVRIARGWQRRYLNQGFTSLYILWSDILTYKLRQAGELDEAIEVGEAVLRALETTAIEPVQSERLCNVAGTFLASGNVADARRLLAQAEAIEPKGHRSPTWFLRGSVALAEGHLDVAHQQWSGFLESVRKLGTQNQRGELAGLLAMLQEVEGRRDAAWPLVQEALSFGSRHQPSSHAVDLAFRACLYAGEGQTDNAVQDLAAAHTEAQRWNLPWLDAPLHLLEAVVQLRLQAPHARTEAIRRFDAARQRQAPVAHPFLTVRLARHLLERELDSPLRRCLVIGPANTWFSTDDQPEPVDLASRPIARRLFSALVAGRLENPGKPLPIADLIAAGWPDDKARSTALENRLWVALSRLRKLGLGDRIARIDGGYAIPLDVSIQDP